MKEEFICFLWQYRLYDSVELTTTSGEQVKVISPGTYNYDSGPDFFAARVEIDGTILVGNIEIHINSSNWYHHRHHNDAAYSNIILHVVMNHDREILDMQNNLIPVIELQNKFDKSLLDRYTGILASKNWVACEKFISSTNCVVLTSWLSRLLVERLERKAAESENFTNILATTGSKHSIISFHAISALRSMQVHLPCWHNKLRIVCWPNSKMTPFAWRHCFLGKRGCSMINLKMRILHFCSKSINFCVISTT